MDPATNVIRAAFIALYAILVLMSLGFLAYALRTRRPSARRIARLYRALGLEGDFDRVDSQPTASLAREWEHAAAQRRLGEGIGAVAGVLAALLVALGFPVGPTALTPEPVVRAALLGFLGLLSWAVGMLVGRYIAAARTAGLPNQTETATNDDDPDTVPWFVLDTVPWFVRWLRTPARVSIAIAGLDAAVTLIVLSAIVAQINPSANERALVDSYLALLLAFPLLLAASAVVEARLRQRLSLLPGALLAQNPELPQQVHERFAERAGRLTAGTTNSASFSVLLGEAMIMTQVIAAQRVFHPILDLLFGCSLACSVLMLAAVLLQWTTTLLGTGPNRIGMSATST